MNKKDDIIYRGTENKTENPNNENPNNESSDNWESNRPEHNDVSFSTYDDVSFSAYDEDDEEYTLGFDEGDYPESISGEDEPKNTKSHLINFSLKADKAIFNVFFSYFNYKKNNPNDNTIEFDGVKIHHIIDGSYIMGNIPEPASSVVDYRVTIDFNGVDMLFRFNSYIEMDELRSYIMLHSCGKADIDGNKAYTKLLTNALQQSELRGAYITMPNNKFTWEVKELDEMSYNDIFLPKDLMENAELFVNLFKAKGLMSRYLLSGIPGSGKTELTRVLSSILQKEEKVTIIKTNPYEVLSQKLDLAKALAPSILIFDDLDLYLGNRNNGNYSYLLGQFLDVLDGVDKLPDDIGIIASTNAPHLIDMAAQRPGRFNKLLFFTSLTKDNIRGIIKKSLKNLELKYGKIDECIYEKFLDDKLVNFFKATESSGSYVYETVIDTKNSLDVNKKEDFSVDELVERLAREKKALKENLKVERIDNSYKTDSKIQGFR